MNEYIDRVIKGDFQFIYSANQYLYRTFIQAGYSDEDAHAICCSLIGLRSAVLCEKTRLVDRIISIIMSNRARYEFDSKGFIDYLVKAVNDKNGKNPVKDLENERQEQLSFIMDNSSFREPFNTMLESLSTIEGYDEYRAKLEKNNEGDARKDNEAEILAIYELNKSKHPITRITGHQESQPEAYFDYGGQKGFLECKRVQYLFDSNKSKDKLINRIDYYFSPIVNKFLKKENMYDMRITIHDYKKEVDDSFLKKFQEDLLNEINERKGKHSHIHIKTPFFFVEFGNGFKVGTLENENMIEITYGKNGGKVIVGGNSDVNEKIYKSLKQKKNQHSDLRNTHLAIYYLFLDAPTHRLKEINVEKLRKILNVNELAYMMSYEGLTIGSIGIESETHVESKLVKSGIVVKPEGSPFNEVDFSNEFIEDYPPSLQFQNRRLLYKIF